MNSDGNVCPNCGQAYEPRAQFCPKDGTPLGKSEPSKEVDPYLGVEIVGQIRLEQLVGIGSMGRVYRAFQSGVERHVAVKILHRELSANEVLVGRFLREARVASRLSHPNVVQVLMTGQLPAGGPGEGAMYIVMEYLDGISLQSALAPVDGSLPLSRALHVVLQVCDAVGEAHSHGIVHRDLKPDNVMLVRRGHDGDFVKVLDFGIARWTWGDTSNVTQTGLVFGTARYISPEGAAGKAVGPPADVYAIATMLYQALAGRTPFEADSPVALLVQHSNEPPPPLGSLPLGAQVPAPLAAVIMQNLCKCPEQRCADARVFGMALIEAAHASGISIDELLGRNTLLGSGPRAHPLPTPSPSLEKTRQLDVGYRLDALAEGAGPLDSALEPASQIASRASGADQEARHGTGTVLASVELPPFPALDKTLDDQMAVVAPTQVVGLPTEHTPSVPTAVESPAASTRFAEVRGQASHTLPGATSPSSPIALSPNTITEDLEPDGARDPAATASRLQIAGVVAGCFLIGAGLAMLGAYHWGLWGGVDPVGREWDDAERAAERAPGLPSAMGAGAAAGTDSKPDLESAEEGQESTRSAEPSTTIPTGKKLTVPAAPRETSTASPGPRPNRVPTLGRGAPTAARPAPHGGAPPGMASGPRRSGSPPSMEQSADRARNSPLNDGGAPVKSPRWL